MRGSNASICPPGPLVALPAELVNYRQGQVTLTPSECCEGRPFLFDLLKKACMLDQKVIWMHIFPYRHLKLMCQSTCNPSEVVYDYFISSLHSWFNINLLTPLNFGLWSVAMLLTIMRDLSKDLEARRIYFKLISEDMADLFRAASPEQLKQLGNLLLTSTKASKSQLVHLSSRQIVSI